MVSPPVPKPNHHPWLFPEGGVSSSQVQGKQGGGGVAFRPREVGSAPPPSTDQRWGSSMAGPWSKGAGSGDELCVFCNLDVSRPDCLLSQPKMDPSGAADYIREDSLFSQGRPDKRGASVPLAIWSQNNRKGPRKKKKSSPASTHSLKWKESCLNRWDGWTDKQTYSKASHIYAEIGTQSTSANKAVYMGSDEQVCKSMEDLSRNGILLCTKRRAVPHIHHYYCKLSVPRGSSISFKLICCMVHPPRTTWRDMGWKLEENH